MSRKSDSWEVWGVEDNTGFSDQKVQQVKTQKVLFIPDEIVEHKYLKSISRLFPRADRRNPQQMDIATVAEVS